MSEKKDFKNFIKDQYTGKKIQEVSELIKERNLGLLPLEQVFTIREGIKQKEEVGYYSGFEKITRKDAGCGQSATEINPTTRTFTWDPQPFKGHIKMCYNDLYNTLIQWKLNNGIKRQDLTNTDYMNFILDLIQDAVYRDFNRYAFFGNTTHSVVGSGSGTQVLKSGENAENFNVINGLFAGFEKMLTSEPEKRYTIAENNESTYALQRVLKEDTAFKAFNYIFDNADPLTFADGAKPIILSTYSLVRNLSVYLRDKYRNELTLTKVEGGYETAEFEGVTIVTHRWLDQVIRRDFDNGTKWNAPHRALLLDKLNEQIGIDSKNSLSDIEVEYVGGDDEHTHIKFGYMADFKRANDTYGAGAF